MAVDSTEVGRQQQSRTDSSQAQSHMPRAVLPLLLPSQTSASLKETPRCCSSGWQESVEAFKWTLLHLYRRGDTVTVLHVMPDAHAGPASGSIYYIPPDDAETERCLVSCAARWGVWWVAKGLVELRADGVSPGLPLSAPLQQLPLGPSAAAQLGAAG